MMLQKTRGTGITIIGALQSGFEPYLSYHFCKSSNADDFHEFLESYIDWITKTKDVREWE